MLQRFIKTSSCVSLYLTASVMATATTTADSSDESHTEAVVAKVLSTKAKLSEGAEKPVLALAFWDFDGTILHGDCSEGLSSEGKVIYDGLVKRSIEKGFSKVYKAKDGFKAFWEDYQYMDKRCGHWLSYPYIPQMLGGAEEAKVRALAAEEFTNVYSKHYFSSSVSMLKQLEEQGVQNYIISASADVFVKEAADSLALPRDRFHGITQMVKDGKLTMNLIYPVTYAEGKQERLQAIVNEVQQKHPDRKVVAVAAFGNSYSTDGAFMKFVAEQKLENGEPCVVMINGGEAPKNYKGIFTEVKQSKIVSSK